MGNIIQALVCYLMLSAGISIISSETDVQDAKVILALKEKWSNTPPSWMSSDDPCGTPWDGITCNPNNRVTELKLSAGRLIGKFPDNIGDLTELTYLDLSFNQGLTGPLPPSLWDLSKLFTLTLEACSFTGSIPTEIGNAAQLSYISLASNNLTGEIPSSIGRLSNLRWLDLSHNFLTGSIPTSGLGTLGIDQLKNLQGLDLGDNQLSGSIQQKLFTSQTSLTYLKLYENKLTGKLPDTLFQVRSLQSIDLGQNSLTGIISSSINNLTGLTLLGLDDNNFTGPIPDLTGMDNLNYVFINNNCFDRSEAPTWFSSLRNLQVLSLVNASLYGPVPHEIFTFKWLQTVVLSHNEFNGTLDTSYLTGQLLEFVDFENNKISDFKLSSNSNQTLLLAGNPYCEESAHAHQSICQPYTTP